MYTLYGLIGRRGFKLEKDGLTLFQTAHKFGMFPTSFTTIADVNFKISPANLLGDKWAITKDNEIIGELSFSNYRYSLITLSCTDGSVDKFRLDEEGYSNIYTLTGQDGPMMKFKASLNPLRVDDKYNVELVSSAYTGDILYELIFYAGEILFRKIKPGNSPS